MQDTMQCGGKPRVRTRWTTFRSLRASLLLCQMALEQLAMISVLARWVEQSQVKRHDDDIAVSSEVTEVDFVKTFEAALHDGTPQ